MTAYFVLERLGDGLVSLRSEKYGPQLWTMGQVRKPMICAKCGKGIYPRQFAFRPLTNGNNRADRLCVTCCG